MTRPGRPYRPHGRIVPMDPPPCRFNLWCSRLGAAMVGAIVAFAGYALACTGALP